jgi:hypothetical protein
MVFAGHHFARAFAAAPGTTTTHEAPMVQEESQQIQVRVAQVERESAKHGPGTEPEKHVTGAGSRAISHNDMLPIVKTPGRSRMP